MPTYVMQLADDSPTVLGADWLQGELRHIQPA